MEIPDYIEQYLNQRLGDSERKNFEERLISDKEFASEVKEYAILFNAFDRLKSDDLKQRMDQIEMELDDTKKNSNSFPSLLKWAAVFALFMMVSTWLIWNNQQSNEELFLAYYTTYPNVETPVVRSGANQQGAWRLYNKGEYEGAYQQFQYSINAGNSDEATWFYLGICALELNRYNQAEEAFKKAGSSPNSRYKEQADWYLALNYLKADNIDEANKSLIEITKSSSSYADKAVGLLGELK